MYVETTTISIVGRQVYERGLSARRVRVDDARREVAKLRASYALSGLPDRVGLAELWEDLSVDERRQLLRAGIDAVVLRPGRNGDRSLVPLHDRVLVLWRGEAPDDFPQRGKTVALRPF